MRSEELVLSPWHQDLPSTASTPAQQPQQLRDVSGWQNTMRLLFLQGIEALGQGA